MKKNKQKKVSNVKNKSTNIKLLLQKSTKSYKITKLIRS